MDLTPAEANKYLRKAYQKGGSRYSSFNAGEPDLQGMNMNRFLVKVEQDNGTQSAESMAYMIYNKQSKNFYQSNNYDQKDARQIVTGTVITNCFIQTSALPSRVELSGNDAFFYDNSVGGTGSISGDSASIVFVRADQRDGTFIMRKRHGVNDDDENVFEMFYQEAAGSSQRNYMFIGRQGDASQGSYTDEIILHGVWGVRAEINRVYEYKSRPTIYTADYNKIDGSKEGVMTTIAGEGKDGYVGMGKLVEALTFASATSFAVGDTITGNATGATAKLIYKVSSSLFYADHTNNIAFNPATDNACTTNGAGGGSGTGDLSAAQFGTALVLFVDPLLNINIDGQVKVNSSSGGRMAVGEVTDAGPMTATAGTRGDIIFNTSDSKFYGCTVTGNPATWVALN